MDCVYGDHISELLEDQRYVHTRSPDEAQRQVDWYPEYVHHRGHTPRLCLVTMLTLFVPIDRSLSGIVISMILTIACSIVEIECQWQQTSDAIIKWNFPG